MPTENVIQYEMENKEDMTLVFAGHVDHGKSTIIGRLLADTGSLPQGRLEKVKETCRRNSKPFEYAFLLDALKNEQAQGITIDSARCFFQTPRRQYNILDAPGHIEFLKNMVTGAARAEAALLVIDAQEGVQENSRRHGYLLSMLGISQISVLVNKMDLVAYDEGIFKGIVKRYSSFLKEIGLKARSFIPVSGMKGDNIAQSSEQMDWYSGPTVLAALESFECGSPPQDKPFRMPIQDVYKFTRDGDSRRIVAGTIVSGQLRVGDELVFQPSGKKARVKTIEAFNEKVQGEKQAGQAVGFTLAKQIYIRRGELASLAGEPGPEVASRLLVNLFWLGRSPLKKGRSYYLRLGAVRVRTRLEAVERVIDAAKLSRNEDVESIQRHDVAECILNLERPIACDQIDEIRETGRFVLVDQYEIAGGGIIQQTLASSSRRGREGRGAGGTRREEVSCKENSAGQLDAGNRENIFWETGSVTYEDRCQQLGQRGLVVWFTGLSGAGKSTIAAEVEHKIVGSGLSAYHLDGDNIRHGLSSDLGFSPADRDENIRRIAEVAALFKDAGLVVLASFISPYRHMREFARNRAGDGFIEVYVRADVETCARRDPKGLYARAREGEIPNFTGISSPYEEPEDPELILDTVEYGVEECVEMVVKAILEEQENALEIS